MNIDPIWLSTGRITLEHALKLPIPNQRCFVYKIDVGGESYIGMTCQNVEQAIERHIELARSGDGSLLHAALRRFGYAYNYQVLSKFDNEIRCLVDKVSLVKRDKPTLNATFGGEGSHFNLVEEKNELGELCLMAEHKGAVARLKREQWRTSSQRITKTHRMIKDRYDRLERQCDNFDAQFILEEFPIECNEISFSRYSPCCNSLKDLSHYLQQRVRRYKLLRQWDATINDQYVTWVKLKSFLHEKKIKLLLPTRDVIRRKIGTFEFMEPRSKNKFNMDAFPNVQRLFEPEFGFCLTEEVFSTPEAASKWLHNQPWFKQALLAGVIRQGDAFNSFKIDAGRYGGFAGLFTKQNYSMTHVIVIA